MQTLPFSFKRGGLSGATDSVAVAMPISETNVLGQPSTISSFVKRIANLPQALQDALGNKTAFIAEKLVYSILINKSGNVLDILTANTKEVEGLTNLPAGKLGANQYLWFNTIRLTAKQFALAEGVSEVPVGDVVKTSFVEVSDLIKNSFLQIKIGQNVMVDKFQLQALSSTPQVNVGVPVGHYTFGSGFLVGPNETLEVTITTPTGTTLADNTYALRFDMQAIIATLK